MNDLTSHRDPATEAAALLPAGWSARVLEPSPPAVIDGGYFADDPTDLLGADPAVTVQPFDPISFDDADLTTWRDLAAENDEVARFAATRWLGPWKRLGEVPSGYVTSRQDYHRLAYAVVAVARHGENGKFGLRFTAGGFGTPFFGTDRQIRVAGNMLVDQTADEARSIVPTTIAEAAAFVGVEPGTVAAEGDSPPLGDLGRELELGRAAGDFLGDWFGFATSVLEELRRSAPTSAAAGRVQLWPGHFDPAVEIGDETAGQRATFGASPGDDGSAEPYLYVGPWAGITDDVFWNATTFPGAVLPYQQLSATEDQRRAALEFYQRAIELLVASV